MSGFVKALAQSVKVITTQMYNPFYWMKSRRETFKAIEERLPGAIDRMKAGEIIPEYEYVTEGKCTTVYDNVDQGSPTFCARWTKKWKNYKPFLLRAINSYF